MNNTSHPSKESRARKDVCHALHPSAQSVLDYWFGDLDLTSPYFKERGPFWFMGGPRVDAEIRRKFGPLLALAVRGRLGSWQKTPKGCLALIILLDQFSLNLYREKPTSYIQSRQAIPITNRMIRLGRRRPYRRLGSYRWARSTRSHEAQAGRRSRG